MGLFSYRCKNCDQEMPLQTSEKFEKTDNFSAVQYFYYWCTNCGSLAIDSSDRNQTEFLIPKFSYEFNRSN